jgi:CRP-like cAMP-binding protein
MERIGLFEGLTTEERAVAHAALKPYVIGADEDLLHIGEADRSLLIVVEGELLVSLEGQELARVRAGDVVGEMTLFGTFDQRSATVTSTVEPTKLLILDEDALRFLRVQSNPMVGNLEAYAYRELYRRVQAMEARLAGLTDPEPMPSASLFGRIARALAVTAAPGALDALQTVPGFASRDREALSAVAAQFSVVGAARGAAVITRGAPMTGLYMVAEGTFGVWRKADRVPSKAAELGPGHVFGRVGSTLKEVATSTVHALEPGWLIHLPWEVALELEQGMSPESSTFRRGMIDALSIQLRMMNGLFLSKMQHADP